MDFGAANSIAAELIMMQVDVGTSLLDITLNNGESTASSLGWSIVASMVPVKLLTKSRFFKSIKEFSFNNGSTIRYSTGQLPEAKELRAAKAIAKYRTTSIYLRGTNVKGADAIINGRLYDIKTLEAATHSAVKGGIQDAKRRNMTNRVIIDGRNVGISYEEAYRGYARARGVGDAPEHMYLILREGIFELP